MCKAQGQTFSPLTPGEAKMAWDRNLQPRPQARAWEYWSVRLKKAGEYPAGAPKAAAEGQIKPAAKRGTAPQETALSRRKEFRKFKSKSAVLLSAALQAGILPLGLHEAWEPDVRTERRQHQRYTINRIAKFQADSGSLPRDCMITDISKQGARLFADGVDVPDQFDLLISGDKGVRRECRVVWRLGGEIGVAFVGPERR